ALIDALARLGRLLPVDEHLARHDERLRLLARIGKPALDQEAVQPGLHGRMAIVAVSDAPPISIVTGTSSPPATPCGIVTLIWYSPANPGATPENATVASMPP